jgi:hypothetical protein
MDPLLEAISAGASMKSRCRGLSGTPLASMFVCNLSITLDIVSGLQLFTSSRSVVLFGSNIDLLSYLIGHFSRVQPYIIDVACHGKLCNFLRPMPSGSAAE